MTRFPNNWIDVKDRAAGLGETRLSRKPTFLSIILIISQIRDTRPWRFVLQRRVTRGEGHEGGREGWLMGRVPPKGLNGAEINPWNGVPCVFFSGISRRGPQP